MNDSDLILSAEGGRRRSRLDIFCVLARFCSALPLRKQQAWEDAGRNRHIQAVTAEETEAARPASQTQKTADGP